MLQPGNPYCLSPDVACCAVRLQQLSFFLYTLAYMYLRLKIFILYKTRSLPFLVTTDSTDSPRLFADTSEHIRFLLFSFPVSIFSTVVGSVR